MFQNVHGIGNATANYLYKRNIRSIDQLRKHQYLLTNTQKIGLKYYEDLIIRIPREECEMFLEEIEKVLFSFISKDIIKIEICGSYRRGKQTCGDVDFLITRKDDSGIDGILTHLVDQLYLKGIMKETLTLSTKSSYSNTFLGICKLKDKLNNRRIDIKIYCKRLYPFALLYFTGSPYFNRSLRLYAKQIGYSLSDHGLIPNNRAELNKEMENKIKLIENENDIFKILGIDYINPEDRDI
jgi:DNA polymerase lambda